MTTLVTGANGFVGRHLVARLPNAIALTRAEADLAMELPPLPHADVVYHCAAEIDDVERMQAVNVDGTTRLLAWAASSGVTRFVLISTGGITGQSEYARTKLAAEEIVRAAGFDVVRLYFPYGPGQSPRRLVPRLIERVRTGLPVTINHDGGPTLALTYIDDVIDALIADEREIAGPAVSLRGIAMTIGTLLGIEPVFAFNPSPAADFVAPLSTFAKTTLIEGLRACIT